MTVKITRHALDRFRQRWPESHSEPESSLRKLLTDQIESAKARGDTTKTPDGLLVPISYLGNDGYAIIKAIDKEEHVTTIVPEDWREELREIRNE